MTGPVMLLDLECAPEAAFVGMDLSDPPGWKPEPHPGFANRKPPKNYKKLEKKAEWIANDRDGWPAELEIWTAKQRAAGREWFDKKAKTPMELRILCIGYAFDDEPPEVIECFEDDEAGLLRLHEICTRRKPSRVVAHNGASYDFRVVQLRAMKHGLLDIAAKFHQEKPWETHLFDTMLGWPVKYTGMDVICAFLGLDRPDNPIVGAEVLQAYVDGRQDEIVAHCRDDIRVLREVYKVVAKVRGL